MLNKIIDKPMSAKEAIGKFISDGDTIGVGGQSIGRVSTFLAHEIVRQQKKNLTLVGCNLSLSMDLLVGAKLVKKTECGSGSFERFGTAFQWRNAIQNNLIEVQDYSHLAMASRFLAGSLGIPFIPSKSMLGTDLLKKQNSNTEKPFEITDNPWKKNDPVVLLPALQPDVSIVHVQMADKSGNVIIEGFTTHEPEMIKASKKVIISCEKLVDTEFVKSNPEKITIPYIFVDAVIEQPLGGYPTSVYNYYEHDSDHISEYQQKARAGGKEYSDYLNKYIYDCKSFEEYVKKAAGPSKIKSLKESMLKLL